MYTLIDDISYIIKNDEDVIKEWYETEKEKLRTLNLDDIEESKALSYLQLEYSDRDERVFDLKYNFYHATFILVYSYFESMVSAYVKTILSSNPAFSAEKNVDMILTEKNASFSPEVQQEYDYVVGDLRKVRNLLTHNYNGTSKNEQEEAAKREHERKIGLAMFDDGILIEKEYITQALEKEHKILIELTKILNLK